MRPALSSAAKAALDKARAATTLAATSAAATPPPHVFTMPVSGFSAKWSKAPRETMRIGVRLVPEATNDFAAAEARRIANDFYPPERREGDDYVTQYNAEVMRHILAHALTSPDDVTQPIFAKAPEAEIAQALTEGGMRRAWHELLELRERLSPVLPEASDDDLRSLGERLARGPLDGLDAQDRRVLRRILDEMG